MKLCYLGLQVRKKNIKKGHKGLDVERPLLQSLLDDQHHLLLFFITFFSISPLPSSLTQGSLRLPPLGFLRRRAAAVAIVTPPSDHPWNHLPLLGFQIAKREPVGSPFKTASPSPPFSVSCVYGKVGCTLFLLKEFCNGYLLVMGLSLINQVYGVLVFTNESTLNFCA